MRVIVFGRKRTVQKLTDLLASEGIEAVGTSDGLDKVIALHEKDMFDLAIVDSLAERVEATCYRIKESLAIPLVLIVDKKQVDWDRLQPLGAVGYLTEAQDSELVARLKAMLRRFSLNSTGGKGMKVTRCPIWQEYCHPSCYWLKDYRCYYKSKRGRHII